MEAGEGRSSSNDLSSAPNSDTEAPFPHSTTGTPLPGNSHPHHDASSIVGLVKSVGVADAGGRSAAPATPADSRQDIVQVKPVVRRPRKKREPQPGESDNLKEKKEKPARKPRSAPGTAANSRKKLKLEHASNEPQSQACTPFSEDLKIAKSEALSSSLLNSASEPTIHEAAPTSQFGFIPRNQEYEAAKLTTHGEHRLMEGPPQSTPRSNGVYDPVRSITRPSESTRPTPPTQSTNTTPPRPLNHASASPAISSIIDPPTKSIYSTVPPTPDRPRPEGRLPEYASKEHDRVFTLTMEVDPLASVEVEPRKPSVVAKPSPDIPSGAPSPKPPRAKEQPPPMPQGSGLLSSSLFGDPKGNAAAEGEQGPTIVLHVDLKGGNQVINFSRLAEEKYGFAALYPRLAEQKARLARIAAASDALERSASTSKLGGSAESGDDDLSVDIDRDSENDGDVMMSGINGGHETGANSGTDGAAAPKRRRRRKIEEYDQEDPFVDDSEMIWEAQAAASKDGFFVYCGPLVPEGEKPAVERADGTVSRGRGRGRGRGGGVGSRGGRGAASAGTNSEAGGGRGGGPGSRGGTTTRKPRMTKADRAMREAEKANREKMATLAAKPPGYPS